MVNYGSLVHCKHLNLIFVLIKNNLLINRNNKFVATFFGTGSMGAGQETTANTLGFCFLELGKNPTVLEKY